MKVFFTIGYYLVLLLLIVVATILFLPVIPIEGNIETKVVLSGSMEPAIRVGSVIVLRPQDEYFEGDIVTFGEDTRGRIPTTHRIIASRIQNGTTFFTTKGDANDDPDTREITESDIRGKVLFSMPLLGYAIDFAKKPLGFWLLIIIPGGIIILDEIRKIIREIILMKRKRRKNM